LAGPAVTLTTPAKAYQAVKPRSFWNAAGKASLRRSRQDG
jgi:hypothetical protein